MMGVEVEVETEATGDGVMCAVLGGRYSGPVCPQPARFRKQTSAPAAPIFFVFNMVKL